MNILGELIGEFISIPRITRYNVVPITLIVAAMVAVYRGVFAGDMLPRVLLIGLGVVLVFTALLVFLLQPIPRAPNRPNRRRDWYADATRGRSGG